MTGIQLPQTPFAVLARHGSPTIEVLTGRTLDVDLLADIPLSEPDGRPSEVLALIPYRQVRRYCQILWMSLLRQPAGWLGRRGLVRRVCRL